MAIGEALARRGKVGVEKKVSTEAGIASLALFGLPLGAVLILIIPAFFVLLGAGVYIIFSLLPFIIPATVFFFCYWFGGKLGMPDTHKLVVSGAIASLALLIPMIGGISSISMGMVVQASAQIGETIVFTLTPTFWAIVAGILFAVIVALGVHFRQKTGSWSSLTMGIAFLGLSSWLGGNAGFAMAEGLVVEPMVGAQFFGGILMVLFGGFIAGAVTALLVSMLSIILSIAIFFGVIWVSGKVGLTGGARLIVIVFFGALLLYPLYSGFVGLMGVSAMTGGVMPTMPLVIVPLSIVAIVMGSFAVNMRLKQ